MYLLFKEAKLLSGQVSLWQALHKADKHLVVTYYPFQWLLSWLLHK